MTTVSTYTLTLECINLKFGEGCLCSYDCYIRVLRSLVKLSVKSKEKL